MKIKDILKGTDAKIVFGTNAKISGLEHNSKNVKSGDLFVCLDGGNNSGTDFIEEAVSNGAVAVLAEKEISVPDGVTLILTKNARKTMSKISCNFFGNPARKLKVIAITGTNGKTTSTFMIKSILEKAGKKVGVVGTNGVFFDNQKIETNMTTPDPIVLNSLLKKMVKAKVKYVVMELSAHSLFFDKNFGIMCDVSVFSNLTQDHLDFFKDMKTYGEAKKKLFNKMSSKFAVLNADDEFSKEIEKQIDIPYVKISKKISDAEIIAKDITHNKNSQSFTLISKDLKQEIELPLLGEFNISNALSAIAVCLHLKVKLDTIKTALEGFEAVAGRFNTYVVSGRTFVVDYAHTPDGLLNILKSAREQTPKNARLISVFGCGGNRDTGKRKIMGEISSRFADITIITSDNPRNEEPEMIIDEIAVGISAGHEFLKIADRTEAIHKAFLISKPDDVIVVAGKGAEDYMEIKGEKIPYSDKDVIQELNQEK